MRIVEITYLFRRLFLVQWKIFDLFFPECSNFYVFADWLKNILSKWGLDPFFLNILIYVFLANLTKNIFLKCRSYTNNSNHMT